MPTPKKTKPKTPKTRKRTKKPLTTADLRVPFPMPPLPPATKDEPTPPAEALMGLFEKMERHKREFIPTTGFNLVGLDDFELPGEELYLIAHYATREEAEAAMKRQPVSDGMFIYGPDDA